MISGLVRSVLELCRMRRSMLEIQSDDEVDVGVK